MTKKFLDITLSFFLIICAIALIFLAINGKKVSKYYSTIFEIQKNTLIELQNTFNNTLLKHFSIMENQAQAQKNFYEKSIIISAWPETPIQKFSGGLCLTKFSIFVVPPIANRGKCFHISRF